MTNKAPDVNANNMPNTKNKLLFVTGILMLIDSILTVLAAILLSLLTVLAIIDGEVNLGEDLSAAALGVYIVFSIALASVSFYAALRGIWQNKLIKCRKLGIVILLLNAVSYVSGLFNGISLNDNIETIIFQIVFSAAMSLTLPILYLIGANMAIKKNEPDRKYKKIIKSI
ncbi:MAG: hypothetical protein ACI4FO_06160 [Acutalibacteraceae bacterium]